MQTVDGSNGKVGNLTIVPNSKRSTRAAEISSIEAAISMLSNIVETACEQAQDLDLVRLINLMDLYRVYLQVSVESESEMRRCIDSLSTPSESVLTQNLGDTGVVSFERFVRDSKLLGLAAAEAARESGVAVSTPLPLCPSANT